MHFSIDKNNMLQIALLLSLLRALPISDIIARRGLVMEEPEAEFLVILCMCI